MLRQSCFLLAALFFALFQQTSIRAQEKIYQATVNAKAIEACVGTEWFGLYLQDKKIGYCKSVISKTDEAVVESVVMSMKLALLDKKTEIKTSRTLNYEAKPPYRLMSGAEETDDGGIVTKVLAKRKGKGFEITTIAAGKERVRQVDDITYDLADAVAPDHWLRSNPKVGDEVFTRTFDLKDWSLTSTRRKLQAIKTSLVQGVETKFFEVETEDQDDKIKSIELFGSDGKSLSAKVGGLFEVRRETEEQATKTEFSSDLFVLGMVKIDRKIGHPMRLTELVLEVGGADSETLTNGPIQTVVDQKEKKKRLVKVGKKHANEMKLSPKDIEQNLAETNDYAISDAKIKELAKEAIKGAKNDEEKAKQIIAFAHDYIKPAYIANLPNIHTLLEKKQGDCKCYSLLVANLCRAAGLPCREVGGLLYMGDDVMAFGGHAWNEIAINGVWVPVDATFNQTYVDAGHVCLGDIRKAGGQLLFSKLNFKVVESQTSK